MNDAPKALEKRDNSLVEYIPYGSQDKIKLTISIVQNLIAVKTKSGHTCSEKDALRFIAMCQAKRLNPLEGDAYLIGYDGREGPTFSLITAHQTYLKRAELHPEFDGMESGALVKDENRALLEVHGDYVEDGFDLVGGWAKVFFKGRSHPMYRRLKLSRFKKSFGVWLDDPAGMIVKCAEADALRSAFPTMLGGLYLREEIDIEKPANFGKPEFSAPSSVPLFSAPPENGAKQAPVVETGQPETGGFNPVKSVRNLCKEAKIGEGKLLDFLAENGTTDGSPTTLEEVHMRFEQVLPGVASNWGVIAEQIGKGGAR